LAAMENVLVWVDRVLLPLINADRLVHSRRTFSYCHVPFQRFPVPCLQKHVAAKSLQHVCPQFFSLLPPPKFKFT